MALTKNLRDGALFLIGNDVGGHAVASNQGSAMIYQNGTWYRFFRSYSAPNYSIRRQTGGNPVDWLSMASTSVANIGTDAWSDPRALRVGDAEWYLFLSNGTDGDVYVMKSTDLGATWTAPAKIISNGATWAASTLASPSPVISGTYYYLYLVGDGDKLGAYRCLVANDPTVSGNWSEAAGSPFYDSAYGSLYAQVVLPSNGRPVMLAAMYEQSGSTRAFLWAAEADAVGSAFGRARKVGTFDHGATVSTIILSHVVQSPQDGYWYVFAYYSGQQARAFVCERPGAKLFRCPAAAPAYWPALGAKGLQFPEAGLSWSAKRQARVVRDRGEIDHLRLAEGGVDGSATCRHADDLADVLAQIAVNDTRSYGDAKTSALMLCERDESLTWDEYHLILEAVIDLELSEGDEADTQALSFSSPLPRPLMGRLNTSAVGTNFGAPGGEDPVDDPELMEV